MKLIVNGINKNNIINSLSYNSSNTIATPAPIAKAVSAASTPRDIPANNSPANKSRMALVIRIPGTKGITLAIVIIS